MNFRTEPLFPGGATNVHADYGIGGVRKGVGVSDANGPHRAADVLGDTALIRQDPRSGSAAHQGVQPTMRLSLLPRAEAAYTGKLGFITALQMNRKRCLKELLSTCATLEDIVATFVSL